MSLSQNRLMNKGKENCLLSKKDSCLTKLENQTGGYGVPQINNPLIRDQNENVCNYPCQQEQYLKGFESLKNDRGNYLSVEESFNFEVKFSEIK